MIIYRPHRGKLVEAMAEKKEFCNILGIETPKWDQYIAVQEHKETWTKMVEEAEKLMKEKKEKEQRKIDKEFKDDRKNINIEGHSSYGFSSRGYGQSSRGKKYLKLASDKDIVRKIEEKLKSYCTGTDWGDYSISSFYKMTIKEFENIVDEIVVVVEKEREEKRKIEEKRIKEREERKNSMEMVILNRGKNWGSDGMDYYVEVNLTDKKSGEIREFSCRNLFDCGFVINPLYSVIDRSRGGIAYKGYWDTTKDNQRIKVKITEIEQRMLDYLKEFAPICREIRF